jgi:hypothetical protein
MTGPLAPNRDNERQDVQITDAGRRMAEAHNKARADGGQGRFIAVRISDGHTTGDVYDTRDDAIRHTGGFASLYAFCRINPGPMQPAEGTAWLALHRRAADAGMPLTGPTTPILPTTPLTDRLLLPHQVHRLGGLARVMRGKRRGR